MSEKLNIVKRKLSDLKHPDTNVRMHPDKQIKELKRSIQKNGQTRLMVIDENNVIARHALWLSTKTTSFG